VIDVVDKKVESFNCASNQLRKNRISSDSSRLYWKASLTTALVKVNSYQSYFDLIKNEELLIE
jgi:hypothetical protein